MYQSSNLPIPGGGPPSHRCCPSYLSRLNHFLTKPLRPRALSPFFHLDDALKRQKTSPLEALEACLSSLIHLNDAQEALNF